MINIAGVVKHRYTDRLFSVVVYSRGDTAEVTKPVPDTMQDAQSKNMEEWELKARSKS